MKVHSLRILMYRRVWREYGRNKEAVTGGDRQLHSDELCGSYFAPKTGRGVQIANDGMGEKCGMCCIEEEYIQDFDGKT